MAAFFFFVAGRVLLAICLAATFGKSASYFPKDTVWGEHSDETDGHCARTCWTRCLPHAAQQKHKNYSSAIERVHTEINSLNMYYLPIWRC